MVIDDSSQARLSHADQCETGPKLFFDQALIIEQDRQGRAGDGGDRIQEAQRRPERETDEPFRPNRPPQTGRLDKDEGKKNSVGDKFDPARMKRGKKKCSDCDAGQQPNENGKYPLPYSRNAFPVDEENVQVDENFDHHQGWVQDTISVENERDRHGERGKSVTKGAIYKGRKQSDRGKNDHSGVQRKHL